MSFIKTPIKGTRDFLPEDMALREYVLKIMKETYASFGFEIIGTPCLEHIENLTSNQGGENEKLIFKILKRGEKLNLENIKDQGDLVDSGLRYDLTVPLSRFYANNMNELNNPFRAFQTGFVWRADRPQKGRYREFMQCDLDIFGEKTNLAEIELITAVTTFLKNLNFQNFQIKINDRRILTSMVKFSGLPMEKTDEILISLDKLDKIGFDGVKEELLKNNFEEEKIEKYLNLFQKDSQKITDFCKGLELDESVVKNLEEIMHIVSQNVEANLVFDPTLVRGMSYYTGPIFEISVEDLGSSIGGGGRYDKMVEKYANISVPAAGFSIGFERLVLLLKERGFKIPKNKEKIAYIINQLDEEKNKKETLENDGYTIIEW